MIGYLGRKVLQYVLVLAVAICVNFALPRLAPGDPLDYLLGDAAFQLSAEQRSEVVDKAATLNAEDRKQPLAEAQKILMDEPPMISLYFPDGTFAYRPEAFSEWRQEIGHGIFHKRSFLPGPRAAEDGQATGTNTGTSSDDDPGGGGAGIVVGVLALGALAAGGALVAFRRRKGDAGKSDDLSGPEVD